MGRESLVRAVLTEGRPNCQLIYISTPRTWYTTADFHHFLGMSADARNVWVWVIVNTSMQYDLGGECGSLAAHAIFNVVTGRLKQVTRHMHRPSPSDNPHMRNTSVIIKRINSAGMQAAIACTLVQ